MRDGNERDAKSDSHLDASSRRSRACCMRNYSGFEPRFLCRLVLRRELSSISLFTFPVYLMQIGKGGKVMSNEKCLSASSSNRDHRKSGGSKYSRQIAHRIAEVREEQGISQRSAARKLGIDLRVVREQEEGGMNLTLSDLYAWQKVLQVPLSHLLVEPDDSLSQSVLERARLVRIMKTAHALLEKAKSPPMHRMATTLVEQLIEIMPELEEVSSWHTVGQRRSLDEYGRILERQISEEWLASGIQE